MKSYARLTDGYADEPRPLREYGSMLGTFAALVSASLAMGLAKEEQSTHRLKAVDVVLIGVASQRLSRLIAKDTVTSFLRAPFTRYVEPGGPGEVNEEPRGEGLQRAVGELLGCPFCLAQWVAAGFTGGLLLAPRLTRAIATIYATESISDFLQLAYSALESRAE